ncbi:signal recognition particle-docking protein FtsY [Roseicella frigidaeris]|uniref:Signal recognition particle receptor FtsY n=1 Tax=Roseicella frigidaeris TaxID=2230885 RepID=A0A327MG18_9PROT|nr:signal recognition particle-docking protein FtsY [Roseicella frigidaeris]RAI61013.1 signal recognition particle-docking protein FtsY [Roseicella frigidaeris]
MALRDWITRLRGRGETPPAETPAEPPPAAAPDLAPPVETPAAAPVPPPPPAPVPAAPDLAPPLPAPLPEPGWSAPPERPGQDRGPDAPLAAPTETTAPPPPPAADADLAPPPALEPAKPAPAIPAPEPVPPLVAAPQAPPPAPIPAPAEEPAAGGRQGWFSRLKAGLSRSTAKLTESVTTLFRKRRLDDEALEELEETLITADLGVAASRRIVEGFRKTRFGKEVTDEEVKTALAEAIAEILGPVARPMPIDPAHAPHVVLVVGVNGTGKTTTIAKLGQQYREQGLACAFVAGDTFRAAAVEQLQIWGDRTGCRVHVPTKEGADAAGLAFDALKAAKADGTEVLLVDTAGRLHNKSALMEELRKIVRVIRRVDETAPHSVLLVLDATTGQNAIQQAKVFKEMVSVSGLAVTKLDGSAKGGVVVALAQEFGLPVHFVGVGEKAADLRPFAARDFARGLMGLD